MIKRVMMMVFIMLIVCSGAWAGELRQISEAPVGKYYFDGTYSIGSHDNELVFDILFVPTVKGEGNPDHTIFRYLVKVDEGICICTERKDYDSNNQLYKDYLYERLISVPIEKVDTIVNALKIINTQSIVKLDVINNSPYHITALFVCPANSEEWQEVLGGTELCSGKQRKVIFNLDNSIHRWDIKVVDSSGGFTVFQNQWIKEDFTSINYYYKNGTGHIRFAVG